jgi:aspartyl-tRNA(Asn)/glutamyl-tRNA(Gln) amidotransferase subunit C
MINEKEIKKLGELARIELDEKEIKSLQKDIGSILDYFKKLKEIDTENVKELIHPLENFNKLREDSASKPFVEETATLIKAAPEYRNGYIKVKKIFE